MDETDSVDWYQPMPLRRRLTLWALAILAVVFAAAYVASPLLAIGNLKLAAKRGDLPRLEQLADLPALRASLRAQMAASLAGRTGRDAGVAAAILLSDSFIDAVLTPSNLAALINGAAFLPRSAPIAIGPSTTAPAATGPADADSGAQGAAASTGPPPVAAGPRGGYVGLNRFDVSIQQPTEVGATVFSFRRRGLFGWRLTDIRLPPGVLARIR